MKKIGFVGAFDKTNLIMYTAKVLQNMNFKVLVIDGTILQKMRYVVPTISRAKAYITEFEKIDFAIGFESMEEILYYMEMEGQKEEDLQYDYILVDTDNKISFKSFNIKEAEKNYFVTGFDIYSLKRGVNICKNLNEQIKLIKVLYSNDITAEDEEYLNYISLESSIMWDNDIIIYCPTLEEDNRTIEENQRVDKIRVKRLSSDYQQAITYIVQNITDVSTGKIKRSIRE